MEYTEYTNERHPGFKILFDPSFCVFGVFRGKIYEKLKKYDRFCVRNIIERPETVTDSGA